MSLRGGILEELGRHGLVAGPDDTAASLREKLNDLYLEEVRRLRERQRAGEIPLTDYALRVNALKERYPLLGLPSAAWLAPGGGEPGER